MSVDRTLDEIIAWKKKQNSTKVDYDSFLRNVQNTQQRTLQATSFYPSHNSRARASPQKQAVAIESRVPAKAAPERAAKRTPVGKKRRRRDPVATDGIFAENFPRSQRSGKRTRDRRTYFGTVRSFNSTTGWGFLTCDELVGDVFLHLNECECAVDDMRVGDEVEFELARTGGGGLQARLVYLVAQVVEWPRHRPRQRALAGKPPGEAHSVFNSFANQHKRRKVTPPRAAPMNVASNKLPVFAATRVRIVNFPWTFTWQRLWDAFSIVGDILSVELDKAKVGQAVITFRQRESARVAVQEYDGGTLDGREIFVRHEE